MLFACATDVYLHNWLPNVYSNMFRYTRLSDIVDHFFLPLDSGMRTKSLPYNNEFNTFTYWREQLPNIDDELNDFLKKVSTEKKNEKKSDKKGKPTGTKNA